MWRLLRRSDSKVARLHLRVAQAADHRPRKFLHDRENGVQAADLPVRRWRPVPEALQHFLGCHQDRIGRRFPILYRRFRKANGLKM